jgi:prepilin-type N-terminal cleavage/methylation domain-containing protein
MEIRMRRVHSLPRRRAGFTLIELLIVIGIIAVLAAIATGAYFRVLANQYVKQSETTVRKIATGFDGQWNAVMSDVENEIRNGKAAPILAALPSVNLPADRDLANAIYLKMRLRQEFPQSFSEVTTSYSTYGISPNPVYTAAIQGASTPNAPIQSAILLYLALTQTRRGVVFNAADVGGGSLGTVNCGAVTFTVFIDAWKTPIGFERWTGTSQNLSLSILEQELSQLPYATSSGNKDTQDPYGKFFTYGPTAVAALHLNLFAPAHLKTSPNYAPVIYSVGPDALSFPTNPFQGLNTGDDILSFRLMVAGQKGN